jgi:hypothetical protein
MVVGVRNRMDGRKRETGWTGGRETGWTGGRERQDGQEEERDRMDRMGDEARRLG